MTQESKESLIGKEVWIHPGDTNKKRGIILDIDDNGCLFKITYYSGRDGEWVVGKNRWISFSARLVFEEY